jgi:hypothetical protein
VAAVSAKRCGLSVGDSEANSGFNGRAMRAKLTPDPLKFVEDALRAGRRSVSAADVAAAFGKHPRTVRRLPIPRILIGGTPWFALADLQAYLGRGKAKSTRKGSQKEAKKVLERFGLS